MNIEFERVDGEVSGNERLIWAATVLAPSKPPLIEAVAIDLPERTNICNIQYALRELEKIHDLLRAIYLDSPSGLVRRIVPPGRPIRLIERVISSGEPWGDIQLTAALRSALCQLPDVRCEPAWLVLVLQFGADRSLVCFLLHHILCDRESMGIIA